jgi:hypothetical protein
MAIEVPYNRIGPAPAAPDRVYDKLRKKFLSSIEEGKEKAVEQKKILAAKIEKFNNTGWWTHMR